MFPRLLEILLLGTGKSVAQLPLTLRNHLNKAGVQVEVMDTVRDFFALRTWGQRVLTTTVVECLFYV